MFNKFYNRSVSIVVSCIIFLTVILASTTYSIAGNLVSIKDAINAAKYHGWQVFQETLNYYDVFPCTNLVGEPTAYCVTFQTGRGKSELSLDTIKSNIKQQSAIIENFERELLSEGTTSEKKTEIENKLQEGWAKLRHDELFVTVITSSDSGKEPIIMMYESLPFHLVGLEKAQKKVKEALNTSNLEFKGIVYLEPLSFWFEFSNDGTPVYCNVGTWEIRYQPDLAIIDQSNDSQENVAGREWAGIYPEDVETLAITPLASNYISGVPDLQQSSFPGSNDCGPVSGANILLYARTHGYPNFPSDASVLVNELKTAMGYIDPIGTPHANLGPGTCTVSNWHYYHFTYSYLTSPSYSTFVNEVNAQRPSFHVVINHPMYGSHHMSCIGYNYYYFYGLWYYYLINRDNWETTPADAVVNYYHGGQNQCVRIYPYYTDFKNNSGLIFKVRRQSSRVSKIS